MKRAPLPHLALLALLLLATTLGGCARRADTQPPMITITDPTSGTVRTADTQTLTVSGYVLDDEGVAAIRVNGVDLLASPIFAAQRGKRLVSFGFRPSQLAEGSWSAVIEAEDTRGHIAKLTYELQIDTTAPTLELEPLESLGGNLVRVRGVARDNHQLASIRVNDTQVPVGQVQERFFSIDIPASGAVTVIATDQAGNRVERQLSR